MSYQFEDVYEFQEKYPTKEEKEEALKHLSNDEIRHLAYTCGTVTGAAWYSKHIKEETDGE